MYTFQLTCRIVFMYIIAQLLIIRWQRAIDCESAARETLTKLVQGTECSSALVTDVKCI